MELLDKFEFIGMVSDAPNKLYCRVGSPRPTVVNDNVAGRHRDVQCSMIVNR